MSEEPRKATDVLLSLERKIDELLGIVRSTDLNNKIMSNKLNDLITKANQQANKIIVETQQTPMHANFPQSFTQLPAGDPERHIPISAENNLPQTNSPDGFRRNSRPETYANEKQAPQMPIQLPRMPQQQPPPGRSTDDVIFSDYNEVKVPVQATQKTIRQPPPMPEMIQEQPMPQALQGQVPVSQRCVDKNGKSIFLADVEVIDMATQQQVFKGRTSAVGKWSVPLSAGGEYRVAIRKRDALTKQQLEGIQDVRVPHNANKLELPMVIIK